VKLEHPSLLCLHALRLSLHLGIAPIECTLEVLALTEAPQGDVDRALQLFRPTVDDVRVDTACGRLVHPLPVVGLEERNHRAERAGDDLRDQLERMLGARAQSDQSQVGTFSRRHACHLRDMDLAGDDLVPEPGYHLGEHLQPIGPLVRDQYAEMVDSGHAGLP
jgi:hypothetical protein